MFNAGWLTAALFVADLVIRLGLSVRVIMRRRPVGVSLAWLMIVLVFPFAGAAIYLLFGELRLGKRRAMRAVHMHDQYQRWLDELNLRTTVDWSSQPAISEQLARMTETLVDIPALPSNQIELIGNWKDSLHEITRAINEAKRTCHLEFYIWHNGGVADEVADALIEAAERGVVCRVLVDAVGSREFYRSLLADRMRSSGVHLHQALPAGIIRSLFVRLDLRMHRKLVVIDGRVAFTGSMNLVDPRFFKQDEGVGQWIDAMARIEGPAVEAMAITFLEDWALEADDDLETLEATGDVHPLTPRADAAIQVVPSGPAQREGAVEQVLLAAIYAARDELVLTTPYFVPNEALYTALMSAAQRGVAVTLVMPMRVDSRLVRLASQAFQGDLAESGVRVMLFEGGLLHTKSVTIDGEISFFGTLNLDPRSLHLNFEITLAVYDCAFTGDLRNLQQTYIDESRPMDLPGWQGRSGLQRFKENTARLVGPLL